MELLGGSASDAAARELDEYRTELGRVGIDLERTQSALQAANKQVWFLVVVCFLFFLFVFFAAFVRAPKNSLYCA